MLLIFFVIKYSGDKAVEPVLSDIDGKTVYASDKIYLSKEHPQGLYRYSYIDNITTFFSSFKQRMNEVLKKVDPEKDRKIHT